MIEPRDPGSGRPGPTLQSGRIAPASGGTVDRDERLASLNPRIRLDGWQERLGQHFTNLAETRREAGWPVFALEHGLGADDREALMRDVRASASVGPPPDAPLPWIVYAAEIGYAYSGYEYWQTFESKTPGWQAPWRERLRVRFRAFAKAYHGAEPDGNWAHHFSIIAWPITHGILPRDLQRQLAALLYEASMSFRAETFSSAESLGLHLQSRSDGCSSRFREFAENATLLGQIALALLLQHGSGDLLGGASGAILHPVTLARIVDDLDRERDARQWLAEARSAARFRVRGLGHIPQRRRSEDADQHAVPPPESSEERKSALPRPHFLMRETTVDHWQVRLQLPNLAHLLQQFPRAREILTRAQGRVGGPSGPLLARGRIVSDSSPTVTLNAWPTVQTRLLTLDGAPPELESVLQAGFRIDAGDRWLFLIGSDGQARQIAGGVLRSGESYLLIQRIETRNPVVGLGIRTIRIACTGVYGLRIDVPDTVTEVLRDVLGILELEVARTLEVWSTGLPAPDWSGDGRAEWLAGRPVVLGVRADRRIGCLTLKIDDLPEEVIPVVHAPVGNPVFVQLPALPYGRHKLTMVAHTGDDTGRESWNGNAERRASPGLRGQLEYVVREPRKAADGQTGALSFAVHPAVPSLEDVWEDRIELHVGTPGATSVRCRMVLRSLGGHELLSRIFTLPSPCDSDLWRRHFNSQKEAAQIAYDEAQVCTLSFDANALGQAKLVAERDFRSLRWAVRPGGHRAVLIDSQGGMDLRASMYRCAAPALEVPLDGTAVQAGTDVEDEGRLLVARALVRSAYLVVVPQQQARSFSSLLVRPQVPPCGRSVSEIRSMVALAETWEGARVGGSALARVRQQACAQALLSSAFGALGGRTWQGVEAQVRSGDDVKEVLRVNGQQIAPAKADQGTKEMFTQKLARIVWLPQEAIEASFVSLVQWLTGDVVATECARFALRLSQSASIGCDWAKSHRPGDGNEDGVAYYLDHLCRSQFIGRAARYLALLRGSPVRA